MEEEEVSSEETSMNQLDTSKEKLYSRCTRGILFSDDGETPRRHRCNAHRKVTGTPTRRAAMTKTMTSGCR
jgi:hypothetical protein